MHTAHVCACVCGEKCVRVRRTVSHRLHMYAYNVIQFSPWQTIVFVTGYAQNNTNSTAVTAGI